MVLLSLLLTDNDAYKPLDRCLALKKERKKIEREREKKRNSFGQLRIPIWG